jgi:hypothetical protein
VNEDLLRRSYERLLVIREHDGPDRKLCPAIEEIQGLVERKGAEGDRLRLLDHVMQCPECRKEFDILQSLHAERPPAPSRGSWRLWAFAAMLMLVAGLGVVWQMTRPREDVFRGQDTGVSLLAPENNQRVQLPVRFHWRSVPGALSYRLELLSSAGSVSWSSEVMDTTTLLEQPPEGAVSGWKVVARFLDGQTVQSAARRITLPPAISRE